MNHIMIVGFSLQIDCGRSALMDRKVSSKHFRNLHSEQESMLQHSLEGEASSITRLSS